MLFIFYFFKVYICKILTFWENTTIAFKLNLISIAGWSHPLSYTCKLQINDAFKRVITLSQMFHFLFCSWMNWCQLGTYFYNIKSVMKKTYEINCSSVQWLYKDMLFWFYSKHLSFKFSVLISFILFSTEMLNEKYRALHNAR